VDDRGVIMKKIHAALIGAGSRGKDVYGEYALKHPNEIGFIAVAEPDKLKRDAFSKDHKISNDMQFSSWEELLEIPNFCDAVVIATQDRMHCLPAITALEKGYHVLLEKPMSSNLVECVLMAEKSEEAKRLLVICHVLRYTPFFSKLKAIIDSGAIGKIVSIQHSENVGYWHQAHSFVRGSWRNSEESSPMILAKSCHDMDILSWLIGRKCIKVSSFGSLKYFREANAPKGSTARCTDGCEAESACAYSALKIYLNRNEWPTDVVSPDMSNEAVLSALKTGPYGRCVFRCDNDVVDHQVVNMEFEDDITAAFTMCAFTKEISRLTTVMGTGGEIRGDMENGIIEVLEFVSGCRETIQIPTSRGHSGGDEGLMKAFVGQLNANGGISPLTSAKTAMQSHLMAFAAEKSRLENRVILIDEFEKEILSKR